MTIPSPAQIILAVVALALMANGIARFARRERGHNVVRLIASLLVWGGVVTFALFPEVPHDLSTQFGLGINLNTLIFAGFVAVFLVIARLLGSIDRLDRTLTELVRHEALDPIRSKVRKP
jgi:hypothetical protein